MKLTTIMRKRTVEDWDDVSSAYRS